MTKVIKDLIVRVAEGADCSDRAQSTHAQDKCLTIIWDEVRKRLAKCAGSLKSRPAELTSH